METPMETPSKTRIEEFLKGGGVMKRTAPRPQNLFEDRQKMLTYHEQHDVFTKDGLLKWQHHALDSVSGQVPRPSRGNNIVTLKKNV